MHQRLEVLTKRYPQLADLGEELERVYHVLVESFSKGGKLLIAGNGGSAADADHIVGELMKSFYCERRLDEVRLKPLYKLKCEDADYLARNLQAALPAIALHNHSSLSTAFANDVDPQLAFAQQLSAYAQTNDVYLALSTSGNAQNVYYAALYAKALEIPVVALTGGKGGRLAQLADYAVIVPETETHLIQELHQPIYHCWCLMLEDYFFASEKAEKGSKV